MINFQQIMDVLSQNPNLNPNLKSNSKPNYTLKCLSPRLPRPSKTPAAQRQAINKLAIPPTWDEVSGDGAEKARKMEQAAGPIQGSKKARCA